MRSFRTHDDAMGKKTDVLAFSDTILAVTLAAGTPKQVAVPAGAHRVLVSAIGDVWMAYGRAAALPTADVLNGAAPELNPGARDITGVSTLGLVAPADCVACLAFFG